MTNALSTNALGNVTQVTTSQAPPQPQQQQQQTAQQSNQQAQAQQQQANQQQNQTQQSPQQQQTITIPGTNIQIPTSVAANGIISGNNIKLEGSGTSNLFASFH